MFAFFGNTQIGRARGVGGNFQFAWGKQRLFSKKEFSYWREVG